MTELSKYKRGTLFCGYDLECDICGKKSARWTIDPPNASGYIQDTWNMMYGKVTKPAHQHHKWKYIKQLKGGTKKQFIDMFGDKL